MIVPDDIARDLIQAREFQAHYDVWGPQRKQTWRYYDNPEAYWTTYPSSGYPPIPEKSENVAWGVDMSGYWNGVADWSIARDTGCKFVIIKAVDGTVTTKNFYANIEGAQKAGIEVLGAYFWLYRNVRISGNAQANAWWNAVKSLGLKILMADFEWTYWNGVQDNPNTDDLYGVVIPFEQLSGKKMMIYSAPGYFSTYFNHAPMWAAYPLCIAHYGVLQPAPVAPWGNNWKMWQLTDRWPGLPLGLDPAVSKASDGDIYHGTIDQFNQEYGVTETPPTPPPSGGNMQYKVVWYKGCNVRTGPSTGYANVYVDGIQKILPYDAVVDVLQDRIPDQDFPNDPSCLWVKIAEGQFAASDYPASGVPTQRMAPVSTPPPPSSASIVGATVHMSDGSDVELVVK